MASYFVENIERITEQMITEELLEKVEKIKTEAVDSINKIENEGLSFISTNKNELETYGNEKINTLNQITKDSTAIYNDTAAIADKTIADIKNNTYDMISKSGFVVKYYDDNNGNVTMKIEQLA